MTAYRDRMVAGAHDAKKLKAVEQKAKDAEAKRAERSTTSKDVKGL